MDNVEFVASMEDIKYLIEKFCESDLCEMEIYVGVDTAKEKKVEEIEKNVEYVDMDKTKTRMKLRKFPRGNFWEQ